MEGNMDIKKMILTGTIAAFGFTAFAQDDKRDIKPEEAPQEVVESFNEEFASARDAEWETDGANYEVDFNLGNEEKEAKFDATGELKMTITEIDRAELPDAVDQKLSQEYADYKFDEFYKVEKEGKTKYKAKAKKDGSTHKLLFDESGNKIEKDHKHKKYKK